MRAQKEFFDLRQRKPLMRRPPNDYYENHDFYAFLNYIAAT